MNFKIIFENSGDSIPFNACRPDVLEYYVDQLTQRGLNKFHDRTARLGKNIAQKVSVLHNSIVEVNRWAQEIMDIKLNEHTSEGYLEQHNLNKLHRDYVHVKRNSKYDIDQKRKDYNFKGYAEIIHDMYPDNIRFPSVAQVIDKLKLEESFSNVNINIHAVEKSFDYLTFGVKDVSWVEFKNPFDATILNNNICNFRLGYRNVGRSLYHKYYNFDVDLEFDDENNFDELVDIVEISLAPPQTIPLSLEYVDWCKLHNKIPSGAYLNIGNIPDLVENLTKYRQIIVKNTLQNNFFSIQLNKGN